MNIWKRLKKRHTDNIRFKQAMACASFGGKFMHSYEFKKSLHPTAERFSRMMHRPAAIYTNGLNDAIDASHVDPVEASELELTHWTRTDLIRVDKPDYDVFLQKTYDPVTGEPGDMLITTWVPGFKKLALIARNSDDLKAFEDEDLKKLMASLNRLGII